MVNITTIIILMRKSIHIYLTFPQNNHLKINIHPNTILITDAT